jgi:hypothetical protein
MSTQEWGVRPVQFVIRVFFNTLAGTMLLFVR